MHRHRPARLLAAAALALVLPLSACTTTSHSSSCSSGTCTVDLTGVQTFEVDGADGLERDLGVGPIEPDAVTLSVYGDQARMAPGQAGVINEVPVEVVSVSGRDVTLRIGATEVESADDDDSSASGTVHRSTTTTKSAKATTAAKSTTTKATATKATAAKSR